MLIYVSRLCSRWDEIKGFQLFQSDPSGNYGLWQATAIGANHAAATSLLKQDYSKDADLDGGLKLALKVLSKTMDSTTLTSEKLEIATVTKTDSGKVCYHVYTAKEIADLIANTDLQPSEES